VDPDEAVIEWSPVAGAAAYRIEIEQDDLGVNLTVTLTPDVSSFAIPVGFLRTGLEYEIGVATVSATGNVAGAVSSITVAETE